jgi:hypothetical protein
MRHKPVAAEYSLAETSLDLDRESLNFCDVSDLQMQYESDIPNTTRIKRIPALLPVIISNLDGVPDMAN